MSGLEGRAAVVTGGGRGIGRAVARRLADAGAAVVVAARSEGEIGAVAAELQEAGREAYAVTCDVTDPGAVDALAAAARERVGPVDVLVNNAGAAGSCPFHRLELEEWRRMFEVNATGSFLCTKAFLPGMLERGWGRVVMMGSTAGLTGARYIAAYAASKHALLGLTRSLAEEVAGRGVTVNAVCPGYVDTPMTDRSVARIAEVTGMDEADAREALRSRSPQGRFVEPEEAAYAVLYLCAEEAGSVNGTSLVIDGGELRR